MRGTRLLIAGMVVIATSLVGASAAPSAAETACGLAGSWNQTTQDVGSTTWVIEANGKATEFGIGNAVGTGALSGGVLTITWTTSNGYAGVYRWTLDTTCKGTGKLTFTATGPGDGDGRTGKTYDSTVTGPLPRAVGCSGAAATRATPEAGCKTRTIATPPPGGTAKLTSPTPFTAAGRTTAVTVAGDLGGTTIVGEGGRTRAQAVGEAVAACWLIGPDALDIPARSGLAVIMRSEEFKTLWARAQRTPDAALPFCLALVRRLAIDKANMKGTQTRAVTAGAAATGCTARRLAFRGRIRKGKVLSLRPVSTNPPTAARYTCAATPTGAIKVTVDGRRAGGLKRQLGRSLDLGVVRARTAPAGASRLTFGFGAP